MLGMVASPTPIRGASGGDTARMRPAYAHGGEAEATGHQGRILVGDGVSSAQLALEVRPPAIGVSIGADGTRMIGAFEGAEGRAPARAD